MENIKPIDNLINQQKEWDAADLACDQIYSLKDSGLFDEDELKLLNELQESIYNTLNRIGWNAMDNLREHNREQRQIKLDEEYELRQKLKNKAA